MIDKKRTQNEGHSIKNYVIKMGRLLIDLACLLCIVFVIIFSCNFGQSMENIWFFFAALIFGNIVVVIVFYFLYLLIDIRDLLEKMTND